MLNKVCDKYFIQKYLFAITKCSACELKTFCLFISGMGYGSQVVVLYSSIYYIIILAWAFLYLFFSFRSELPWASCRNSWNTGRFHYAIWLSKSGNRFFGSFSRLVLDLECKVQPLETLKSWGDLLCLACYITYSEILSRHILWHKEYEETLMVFPKRDQ